MVQNDLLQLDRDHEALSRLHHIFGRLDVALNDGLSARVYLLLSKPLDGHLIPPSDLPLRMELVRRGVGCPRKHRDVHLSEVVGG